LACAIKGYRLIITLPEKMSNEKVNTLLALGAEIIRTPTEAAWDAPESHIGVAKKLNKEIPNSHIMDQYSNPSNPMVHYDETAEEILYQCDGKVDKIVIGAGTGGTITGIARKVKEKLPNCIIVGVDPHGSILARPETLNTSDVAVYSVEGIGYDFVPKVLDHNVVDVWIKSNDQESFDASRKLIQQEGILCGGSSGSLFSAALKAAKDLRQDQRCVVICPDSIRNYMSKFLSDSWMVDNGYLEPKDSAEWWATHTVANLGLSPPITIESCTTIKDAIKMLKNTGIDQIPVIDKDQKIIGTVTIGNLTSCVVSGRIGLDDCVEKALYRQFKKVSPNTNLAILSRLFSNNSFVIVEENGKIVGVASGIDLLNYISRDKLTEEK